MSRETLASLHADLDRWKRRAADEHDKYMELSGVNTVLKNRDKERIEMEKNLNRLRSLCSEMRGFIRAHHTEKRPTGGTEYNNLTGQVDPILRDIWPFMDEGTEL